MLTVHISDSAQKLILQKMADHQIRSRRQPDSVPTLNWAVRAYAVDKKSGKRTDYGPGFYFHWSTLERLKGLDYVFFKLSNGEDLALGVGAVSDTGTRWIDQKDGRLTLDRSDQPDTTS